MCAELKGLSHTSIVCALWGERWKCCMHDYTYAYAPGNTDAITLSRTGRIVQQCTTLHNEANGYMKTPQPCIMRPMVIWRHLNNHSVYYVLWYTVVPLHHPSTTCIFYIPRRFLTSVSISRSILTPLSLNALSSRLRESSASLSRFSALRRFFFSNWKQEETGMKQTAWHRSTRNVCKYTE